MMTYKRIARLSLSGNLSASGVSTYQIFINDIFAFFWKQIGIYEMDSNFAL